MNAGSSTSPLGPRRRDRVEILNQIDDHSRLAVASDARATFKAADVVAAFRRAAAIWGIPAHMLSDNGAVFTGIPRHGGTGGSRGRAHLSRGALPALPALSPPRPAASRALPPDPETLARQTARGQDPARLQAQLDSFRDYYNTTRPHRALGRRTPLDAFHARPKATPTGAAITEGHYRVRQDRVCDSGTLTLRYDSRLHHIGLGRRHAGQPVLVLAHDLHVRVLTEHGELLRDLTLDPTRNYQPQPKT